MTLDAVCQAVETSGLGRGIDSSPVLWPTIETIHLAAMVVLVGTVSFFDLRLLGLAVTHLPVSRIAARVLPWSRAAFGIMILTGSLLFASEAQRKYCFNPAFRIKLMLLLLAGVNVLIFEFTAFRRVSRWDASAPPLGARLAGAISILLWGGVIIAGRWIGFAVG